MADSQGKTILQLTLLNGDIDRANSFLEIHVVGQAASKKISLEALALHGLSAKDIVQLTNPDIVTDEDFVEFITGEDGKDAYEVAVAGGYQGNRTAWLASLKGAKGDAGNAGQSAFQIAQANGYQGTEQQWGTGLNSAVTNIPTVLQNQSTQGQAISTLIEDLGGALQTVAAHTQTLAAHGQSISQQGQTLSGHTQALETHAETLADHATALDTQAQGLADTNEAASGLASEVQALQAKTKHVQANKNPDVIPEFIGQQWLNTDTGINFEAKGLLIGDWVQGVTVSATGKISSQLIPGQMTLTTANKDWPHPSVYLKARLVSGANTSIRFLDQNNTDLGTFELDEAVMRSSDQLTGLAGGLRYEIVSGTGVVEAIASVNA